MNVKNDDLGNLVYAALLGEATWQYFLNRLGSTVPNGKAALVVHDTSSGEGFALFGSHDGKTAEQYNNHYGRLNPLQPLLSSWAIGVAGYDEELLPRNDLAKTEFYNDFLVPHGLTHTAGVRLAGSGSQSYSLAVSYDGESAPTLKRSIRRLNALAPHLKRAFGFYFRRAQGQQAGELSVPVVLDTLDVGVIFVCGEQRATTISKAAQAMLDAHSLAHVSADGRVRFRQQNAQVAYEQMLKRNYGGPRTLEFASHQTKATLVHVDKEPEPLYFEGATVIILLERSAVGSTRVDFQSFSNAHGLSKSELRALSGIFEGKSLNQIAADASLSRETIRSQTKSLYAKTGTTGAADILRLLHQARQRE